MDKVKVALAILQKHHFWFLCGLVAILALVVWFMATGDLADRFNTRKTTLENLKRAVQTVSSTPDHPNDGTISATQAVTATMKQNVFETWQYLYEDQKANNVWPRELGQEFANMINSLGPDEDIPPQYLERYHYFIMRHIPALLEILDARLPAQLDENGEVKKGPDGKPMRIDPFASDTGSGGGTMRRMGGGMGPAGMGLTGMGGTADKDKTVWVGKVVWDENDLRRVKAAFDWVTRPTSEQVRLAQEDLWVYEALLRIIRSTNEGATRYDLAAVKYLKVLEIGRDAAQSFQNSTMRVLGNSKIGGGESGGMANPMMGGGAMPMLTGMGPGMEGGAGKASESPLNFRYVDEKLQPLAADAQPPFAEFKMMPVRMVLVMDQRKIPKLLVNCANSSMPVEVRMLSLCPGQGQQINLDQFADDAAGAAGGMGGVPGMAGGVGPRVGGMTRGGYGAGAGRAMDMTGGPGMTDKTVDDSMFDLPVEIQGIIYIFNPPDMTKLGTGSADDQSATATVPVGATSATAPVAPAAPLGAPPAPGGAQPAPAALPAAAPAAPAESAP